MDFRPRLSYQVSFRARASYECISRPSASYECGYRPSASYECTSRPEASYECASRLRSSYGQGFRPGNSHERDFRSAGHSWGMPSAESVIGTVASARKARPRPCRLRRYRWGFAARGGRRGRIAQRCLRFSRGAPPRIGRGRIAQRGRRQSFAACEGLAHGDATCGNVLINTESHPPLSFS